MSASTAVGLRPTTSSTLAPGLYSLAAKKAVLIGPQGYDSRHLWPADAASSSLSGLSWLAVARLALVFYCAGNWAPDDEMPLQHLAELIDRLAVIATLTEPAESSALAAVAGGSGI